jgi:hypothetical protein
MKHLYTLLLCFWGFSAIGQNAQPPLLRVYLDRFTQPQDYNYLRTTLTCINYTDQPEDCDVRVQLTSETVGNSTDRYILFFYGEKQFAGQNDTVMFIIPPMTNNLALQNMYVETLKQGLLPYLAQTEWASQLQVSYDAPAIQSPLFQDYWNLSTFSVRFGGALDYSRQFVFSGFTEDLFERTLKGNIGFDWWHVGQKWRFASTADAMYFQRDANRLGPLVVGSFISTIRSKEKDQSQRVSFEAVRSLTKHFSTGGSLDWDRDFIGTSNRFQNQAKLTLGVEYNLFPYSDFFRRRLLVNYNTSIYLYNNQIPKHPTIRLPQQEVAFQYALRVKKAFLSFRQSNSVRLSSSKWNTWSTGLDINTGIEIKRNLFLSLDGRIQYHNENPISALGPILPDVYTNKARTTTYYFYTQITYLFGSGYRNILNPGLNRINTF